jgi:hypothetical protein
VAHADGPDRPMKLRHVYLFLCVVGFLLPYSQFVPWVMEHGFSQ